MPTGPFAHSRPGRPKDEWEPLPDHLEDVGKTAGDFAEGFGWRALAYLAGKLHDIGKLSPDFQAYIDRLRKEGGDHSSAGAQVALAATGLPLSVRQILAFIIAGHHAGLADGTDLAGRLAARPAPPQGWEALIGSMPKVGTLQPMRRMEKNAAQGFSEAFLIRMLFSCLVDADFLETERFYAPKDAPPLRGGHESLEVLRDRLRAYMDRPYPSSQINDLRARVLKNAVACAAREPGLFTLTVPTGGGKTLASLSFALEHAVEKKLKRIVYVIPFTSIIEQTAEVFREALGTRDDILEHHASFDWEAAAKRPPTKNVEDADEEGRDGLEVLRRASENWDVPVVVTTSVQFFESLFANRTSRCRKLHNLADSVIVLDEAQTLPLPLLRPCIAALNELTTNYRTSAVLCTATQPALKESDGFRKGLNFKKDHELAPDPPQLFAELKRVTVERRLEPVDDATIAARFAKQPQMLCIVNTRKHARAVFGEIKHLDGAVHLTTLMCPRHRRLVLAELRRKLKDGEPVRLVATSLIECGVDISFPEVWRAAAGLDSIAQAAGRCNREGGPVLGRVVIFEPAGVKPPPELDAAWQAAKPVLRSNMDPLGDEAVSEYFKNLYWQKGDEALDAAKIEGRPGILRAIGERTDRLAFPFAGIAAAFRFIEDAMEPVVVPWRVDENDREAENILNRMAGMDRPLVRDLRALQQYTVSIPKRVRDEWLTLGLIRPVHPALGDALLRLDDLARYDPKSGVDFDAFTFRSPADLIVSS